MEEIYQALIEEGVLVRNGAVKITRPLNALKIPTTVQAILAARIDRLPPEQKDLLETVSVIGKDFRLGLVRKVVARANEELEQTLAELQLAEFIYEQPAAGNIQYRFKHQLTREAAYNSVLVERRKALHERIAQAIGELAANALEDHLTDLAYHYERSGNRLKAVEYLTRAGTRIAQRSAYTEAMLHFGRALEILKEMPAGRSRDSIELQLQMVIAGSATVHQGEGSAEAGKASARALELAVGPEHLAQRVNALYSLGIHYVAHAKVRRASEVARDLYECARGTRNPEAEFWANVQMGSVASLMGEFREAEQFMRTAAASDSVSAMWRSYPLECRSNALWVLGFPDQALALAREGLRLAENADHRYLYAAVFQWAGFTHTACGQLAEAEELFRRSFNLGTESGFPWIRASNTLFIGLVSILRGQRQAGLEQLRKGMEYLSTSSAFGQEPQFFAHWAAAGLAAAGRPDEAFDILTPALEWAEKSGVATDLAAMHQLKGHLLEGQFHWEEAENSFRTAIEIARRQSAKSRELQATTSLTRFLAKQGRRDEARSMLAEIYNWFTEGFDTADLKDAKALLEELTDSA
jgi:tetratricopeptide (TPR) repeat protein